MWGNLPWVRIPPSPQRDRKRSIARLHSLDDMHFKKILYPAVITALILLIPFVAMRFSSEVMWDRADFVIAGLMIFSAGLLCQIAIHSAKQNTLKAAYAMAIGTALLLSWMNLAVGIIGSENESANLMYFGVIAIGGLAGLTVKFRPDKMASVMKITATAHALTIVIALAAGMQHYYGSSVSEIIVLNSFFVILWLAAAHLFSRSSKTHNTRREKHPH